MKKVMKKEMENISNLIKLRNAVLGVLVLLMISTASAIADEKKDTSEEVQEAAAAIEEFTIEQKDNAVAEAKELMDTFDEKMEIWEVKIEENWGDVKDSSKKYYRASIIELRKLRNDVSEWYGSMKYSSKETWEEVKQGFSKSYDKMTSALQEKEDNPEQKE